MNSYKKTARVLGALFIFALVLEPIGTAIYEPILNASNYLANAYPNKIRVIAGILIEFICAPAIILIPMMVFPIFNRYQPSIALGYVGFRLFEAVLFVAVDIAALYKLSLSQQYLNVGASNISFFQILGDSIHAAIGWITLIYIIVFTLGALLFYFLLYKSKLLPRFISVWGLFAAALLLTGALVAMFSLIPLKKVMVIFGPLVGLNELVLSIWMIVKGFNLSAITSEAGKTDIKKIK
jgi:hypothetical protein